MYKDKHKLFVDIETSGLSPEEGAIILSVGMIADMQDLSTHSLVLYRKPTEEEWSKASPEALKLNGHTFEELQEKGLEPNSLKLEIINWLYALDITNKTSVHVGQNPDFDIRFLKAFMAMEMDLFSYPRFVVDTISLAKLVNRKFPGKYKFENFKGWGIARAIGIEEEGDLHTALGGVEAVKRNYQKLSEILGE